MRLPLFIPPCADDDTLAVDATTFSNFCAGDDDDDDTETLDDTDSFDGNDSSVPNREPRTNRGRPRRVSTPPRKALSLTIS